MTEAEGWPLTGGGDDFVASLGSSMLPHLLRRASDGFVAAAAEWYLENGLSIPPRATSTLLLLRRRGPQTATAIARALRQSHQLATVWLRQLTALEMVSVASDPADGRRRLVSLTEAGIAEAERFEELSASLGAAYERLMRDAEADMLGGLRRIEKACAARSFLQRLRDEQAR